MTSDGEAVRGRTARRSMRIDQILGAARLCFRRHGFHGASMATLADEAGMSVGQMYRFFPSKEDIIAAIVQGQVDEVVERFPSTSVASQEARQRLSAEAKFAARDIVDTEWAALTLEIRAEATRNPAVLAIVKAADAKIEERVRSLVASGLPPTIDPVEIDRRSQFLTIVIDGLFFRLATNPSLDFAVIDNLIDVVCNSAVFAVAPSGSDSGTLVRPPLKIVIEHVAEG